MPNRWSVLVVGLVGCLGCQPRSQPDAGGSSSVDAGADPALGADGARPLSPSATLDPACVEDVPCAADVDCGAGTRCNLALDPPRCSRIYCSPLDGPCSVDEHCPPEHGCYEGRCHRCEDCGPELGFGPEASCVDLRRDPQHCGACYQGIPFGASCADGAVTCAEGLTVCGSECADLQTSAYHCGACGQVVGPEQTCEGGVPVCAAPFEACGAECVLIDHDWDHCGGCNQPCGGNGYCIEGRCGYDVQSEQRSSCETVCNAAGWTCAAGAEHSLRYLGGCTPRMAYFDSFVSCSDPPVATATDGAGCSVAFSLVTCACLE